MNLYLDIETNYAHDTVWCAGVAKDGEAPYIITDITELKQLIANSTTVIGHDIVSFDAPVLKRVWGVVIPFSKMYDTLLVSRVNYPDRVEGHSLDAWGGRLGLPKGDYTDHDSPLDEAKATYCKQDIEVTRATHKALLQEIKEYETSAEAVMLEHEVAFIIEKQVARGVYYRKEAGKALLEAVEYRMAELEAHFARLCPPREVQQYSIATKKPLKPRLEHFNIGSRIQIVEKMFEWGLGHSLTGRTDTGRYKIDEDTLAGLDTPEAKLLNEYLTIQKRQGLVASWNGAVAEDGRIHGRVITNGAATGRMTHLSPNLAQVPKVGTSLGKECRGLFAATPGKVLVGIDASGLELRMLAHYMRDMDYVNAVVSGSSKEGTDVHTMNQKAAGLSSRDDAKTFIYAFLYGAGPGKIGSIAGGGYKEGQKMIDSFMAATPALRALKSKVDTLAARGYLPGLDGRRLWVRSAHAALNTLLQGAGAIVMKKALVILYNDLRAAGIDPAFVLNIHDEWQIEATPEQAETVGQMGADAIRKAGEHFSMRCPLAGEYKAGLNWAQTH
jgi:DNA polymerase I-like protein with 3'-5' exonuclease and polymerase domains